MGIISIEQTSRLFWLGRYTERVYTTIRLFSRYYDAMLDDGWTYSDFCTMLEIPDVYSDRDDFNSRYPFDAENPDSICSNLFRAYDNAIVLREEIGSEALSYIQLAIYAIKKAQISKAPLLELQNVEDNLLAFWGIADDFIDDEVIRNIIKAGKRIERIDLYGRLKIEPKELRREFKRMEARLLNSRMAYSAKGLERLRSLIEMGEGNAYDYNGIVQETEGLVDV